MTEDDGSWCIIFCTCYPTYLILFLGATSSVPSYPRVFVIARMHSQINPVFVFFVMRILTHISAFIASSASLRGGFIGYSLNNYQWAPLGKRRTYQCTLQASSPPIPGPRESRRARQTTHPRTRQMRSPLPRRRRCMSAVWRLDRLILHLLGTWAEPERPWENFSRAGDFGAIRATA